MRRLHKTLWLMLVCLAVAIAGGAAWSETARESRPEHKDLLRDELRVLKYLLPPDGFVGNLAYDPGTARLWLISYGPPANTRGPSTLYELNASSGEVKASVEMPFKGEFGPHVYLDGFLYQCVFHESRLYVIDVRPGGSFGNIVRTVSLPTLLDLEIDNPDEVFRFPFISFHGATVTPEQQLLLYADELAEFITIDKLTGRVQRRTKTTPDLQGVAAASGPDGEFFILARMDPVAAKVKAELRRFLFRGEHTVPASHHSGGEGVGWVLLDGSTGAVLRSIYAEDQRPYAATIPPQDKTKRLPRSLFLPFKPASLSLIAQAAVEGKPYGSFTFLTTTEEGIWQLEWTPE